MVCSSDQIDPAMNIAYRTALFGAILSATAAIGVANATSSISYTASTPIVGQTTFNFSDSLTFPQFDPALGTLTSISFTLNGSASADQKFENLSGTGGTVVTISTGTMSLFRPNNTALVVTIPSLTNSIAAAQFDGSIDFAGTSGHTYATTSFSNSDTQVYSGGADLLLFTGNGTIALPFTAVGNSSGSGTANLITQFGLAGAATATVQYNFTPTVVPEASTYGSIGAVAIVGFLGYRRSRRTATTKA